MICLLLTIIFFIILFSKDVIDSVSFSISIWKDNLFPTLFPFFTLSNLLMQYGFVDILGILLKTPMQKYFHLPGECGFVLAASLFSGFPSGAKYTCDLLEHNKINKKEAERLLTFTHYSNPLFILGMIATLLNSKTLALIIMISHVSSGLLIGYIINLKYSDIYTPKENKKHIIYPTKSFGELFTKSVLDSLNTMFLLLGIVTIFLIITTIINHLFTLPSIIQVILSGMLEMTQGIKLASDFQLLEIIKVILITGIISFGGFSVHMQVIGIISSQKIKYKPFLLARILHSLLASFLVFLLYVVFL